MCDRGFDDSNDYYYDTIAAETINLLQNEPVSSTPGACSMFMDFMLLLFSQSTPLNISGGLETDLWIQEAADLIRSLRKDIFTVSLV